MDNSECTIGVGCCCICWILDSKEGDATCPDTNEVMCTRWVHENSEESDCKSLCSAISSNPSRYGLSEEYESKIKLRQQKLQKNILK